MPDSLGQTLLTIWNVFRADPLFVIIVPLLVYTGWRLIKFTILFLWAVAASSFLVFMKVTLPRNDSKLDKEKETKKDFKEKMAIMDQLYRGIYEIRDLNIINRIFSYLFNHDTISFELVVKNRELSFYAVAIPYFAKLLEKQITSLYTDAEIEISNKPYEFHKRGNYLLADYLYCKRDFWFPVKTYKTMEE